MNWVAGSRRTSTGWASLPRRHVPPPRSAMSTTTATSTGTTPPHKDRTHYLYLAVVVAVLLGIAVGFIAPAFAVQLKPIGDAFVALIRMMISPIIFCTIVLGVGSVRS